MKVLLAGESWITEESHTKGFTHVTLCRYEEPGIPFVKTLEGLGMEVTHIQNHLAQKYFPETAEELSEYDVVILSDITSDTLLLDPDMMFNCNIHGNRLQAIKEYVKNGGGFVMIGGYMSFAGIQNCARYNMTPLKEVIPVTMMNYDDRIDTPEGVAPYITNGDHPILKGVHEPWPRYLGHNYVEAKPGCEVLAEFDGSVALACGTYGEGRTVATAFDALPHWALPEVLEWECYNTLWDNIVKWAAKKI